MKIRCSNCATVFGIPDEKLAGKTGKLKVRCPKCSSVLAIQAPSSPPTPPAPDDEPVWYYAHEGAQEGPITMSALGALLEAGTLDAESLVWRPGVEAWAPVADFDELQSLLGESAPETVEAPTADPDEDYSERTMEIDIESVHDEDLLEEEVDSSTDDVPVVEIESEDESVELLEEMTAEQPEEEVVEEEAVEEEVVEEEVVEEEVVEEEATGEVSISLEDDSQPESAISADDDILKDLDDEDDSIEISLSDDDSASDEEAEYPTEPALSDLSEEILDEISQQEALTDDEAVGRAHDLLSRVGLTDEEEEDEENIFADEESPAPSTSGADDEDDMFAGFGGGDEEAEGVAGDQPETRPEDMVHTRRETSVLFSLDDFVQKEDAEPQSKPKQKSASVQDSGLIDIRQIAAEEREEEEEDLFASFAAGDSGGTQNAMQAAVAMPILKKKKVWPKVLGIAAALVLVLGGGAVGAYTLLSKVAPQDVQAKLEATTAQAFKNLSDRVSKLQDEHMQSLLAARSGKEEKLKTVSSQQDDRLESLREKKLAELESVRSEQSATLAKLESERKQVQSQHEMANARVRAAQKEMEARRKAAILAGASNTEEKKEEVVEEKKEEKKEPRQYTKEERKRYLEKKRKADEERKKREAARKEEKKEEKKVVEKTEKKEEMKEEKKGSDILAILDKKGGGSDDGGEGGTPKKKTLTTRDVMQAVNSSKGSMRQCFTKYGGGLDSATIRTKVTISGSGSVTKVAISSMQFAGTALGNCVSNVQKKMKFPAFAKPSITKSISVRLP